MVQLTVLGAATPEYINSFTVGAPSSSIICTSNRPGCSGTQGMSRLNAAILHRALVIITHD